jgi:Icc-related predicted phosphoesterase
MRLVVISDTHFMHDRIAIPDADMLVHCGDSLGHGTLEELAELDRFLGTLPHEYKILVAGNHDWCFERDPEAARRLVRNAIYLEDAAVELGGTKFYGSPWQPWFLDWAFNLERGEPLREVWSKIPEDTEVLITHGPPYGVCDRTLRGELVGCEQLLERVQRVKPKLHLFGHIHEGYGTVQTDETLFVNASTCDVRYRPINQPIVLTI